MGQKEKRFDAMKSLLQILLLLSCSAWASFKIEVKGNKSLSTFQVLEVMDAEPEDSTTDAVLTWNEDADYYIADLYRTLGYFEVDVKTTAKKTEKKWEIVIQITEGPRYAFDTVQVLAAPHQSDSGKINTDTLKELPGPKVDLKDLEAKAGKPYESELLLRDRRFLLRLFGDAGYVRAQVNDKFDIHPKTKSVTLSYFVDASYPVIFDTLIIRNLRANSSDTSDGITKESLLRSLVPYHRGDTVRLSMSDKLIEKLQYTGAFNYVRFKDSLEEDSTHGSILYLESEEHVPGNFRSSIFYETQYGPGISADARHSNVAGTLNEVRLGASFAGSRQNGYVGYGNPLTFGFLIRFDDDVDVNWVQDQPVHIDQGPFGGDFRTSNSSRLTFPLTHWLRLVANAELEAKSRMLTGGLLERDFNLNFIQTAFVSFLNQQMDPTRGLRFSLTWGNGGPFLRDNVFDLTEYRHNWLEIQTAQYYYLPRMPQVKFATRLDGGRFFGAGGSNSERFFLGGSRSVRSYNFQSLCLEKSPNDSATGAPGVCVGQEQSLAYVLASAEIRFEPFGFRTLGLKKFWKNLIPLQVVPFVDVGNIWDTRGSFTLDKPKNILTPDQGRGYAYGMGIRYPLFGIFNLRLDYAIASGDKHFWIDLAQAF